MGRMQGCSVLHIDGAALSGRLTTMPTIRELAKQAYDAMESDTRGTGETFYKFKSDRPEWMLELEQAGRPTEDVSDTADLRDFRGHSL
jgi:hypothetical protein